MSKEEVIAMVRKQHEEDLRSLLSFLDQVWPEDDNTTQKGKEE